MNPDLLGPIMFGGALLLIFMGYPVAFALGGTALGFAAIGINMGLLDFALLQAMSQRIFGVMQNYTLLAVPFFILMGMLLERTGLAEDLLKTMGIAFGRVRGGLGFSVVIVGTLLAAATGVVGATVVAMGLIALPIMLENRYSKSLACGIISASGTLGQVIPPSIVLIVLADQLGAPVGDLFVGSLIPGLMLSGLYMVYIGIIALLQPKKAPAMPKEARDLGGKKLSREILVVMIPPLALIVVVLGSIFAGWATPTEAGAFGAVGAMVLAVAKRRLTLASVLDSMTETAKLTSMVMFILVGSQAFSLVFRGLYGDLWVEDLLTSLPGGAIGFLILVNLVVFVLGFFIDFFEIAFIIVPLLAPVVVRILSPMFAEFDEPARMALVWFGVMIGMNLQTSFLTPPFGFSLFYLRGVAPKSVTTGDIYRGAVPFIIIQLIGLISLFYFPQLVTGLLSAGVGQSY
ncbi:TRAP transporter large permease [Sedimenticola selenatireducens]|uniref:TRAP transporter large permease protein n=1 Tax=Sedimenticola selenatireducens TaxID=191960 RepID=A0A558DT50_9GAMM|nr:TRAP transporter large permease subunit [Sedimenticola selenatireducens]TVO76782.1 TRAP transporter large permease subunit [Sedimenticola selenatireducens]TVT64225.1 MAG: TRAP transporter large permease subunit [Sedimenticola selenatireducens]